MNVKTLLIAAGVVFVLGGIVYLLTRRGVSTVRTGAAADAADNADSASTWSTNFARDAATAGYS